MKNLFRAVCFALLIGCTDNVIAQIPALSSNPSASATLFLDFDGHTVTGTAWNGTDAMFCAPSGLTNDQVTEIFNRVSEDYRPFDLNVTTDSTKFIGAPIDKRERVIITVTDWYQGVGGVALIGSFIWGDDTPCFIFSSALNYRTKYIAEAVAHEAGHTLGLYHQAVYDENCVLLSAYNYGTGTGEIGWAPIMGVGYYQNMTLWNNGPDPYSCNQPQNELKVITTLNGFGYRTDDYADTLDQASNINFSNNQFNVNGMIGKSGDRDVFKFIMPVSGEFKLNGTPYSVGANNAGSDLDIQVTLYNSSQTQLSVFNPDSTLNFSIDTTLDPGLYYAKIEGRGNEFAPNYASLGSYSLQASFIDHSVPLPLRQLELTGLLNNKKHELNWLIDADEKVISQSIESSTNGRDFTILSTPSVDSRSYSYVPSTSGLILYRISVVFGNDKKYFSNTISLRESSSVASKPRLNGNIIADRYLSINSPGNYAFRVMDLSGKTITKGQITNGISSVNTTIIAAGLYLINFSNGKEQWTEKFVKQ